MGSTEGEDSVILINEHEAENSLESSSVLVVEKPEETPLKEKRRRGGEVVDEDCEVLVTFCKQAKVMPHARYDCMTHPFERVECEITCPLRENAKICCQCYCYICDKLASECVDWTTPLLCHCNAHNKSKYWKSQWAVFLTGGLAMFNLELSEIDSDVRRGGELLQTFTRDVSVEYSKYLSGERVPSHFHECLCYRNLGPGQCEACKRQLLHVMYRYTPIFELVTSFLNEAEKESPKAEALVLLGVANEIALHKDPASCSQGVDLSASLNQAVPHLMARITRKLQRLLVLNDFPKVLRDKLVCFYQSIPLPTHCSAFSSSLYFLSWDHGLLTSVLRGQNVTGQRTRKGKKECLCEIVPVIEARIERLEGLQQYKELIRYLKVVKCNNAKWLQSQRDNVAFYMCKQGDFVGAVQELFAFYPKRRCTACRLTPIQFETYLKMFRTGCVPSGRSLEDSCASWHRVGVCLKVPFLLKRTFMVLYSSPLLYKDPRCWINVIMAFSSEPLLTKNGRLKSLTLEEPPLEFQEMVLRESFYIVEEFETKVGIQVTFASEVFGTQLEWEAGLIFVVQALRKMILKEHCCLMSFLEIVLAFGSNFWALKLLFESLSYQQAALSSVVSLILTDIKSRKTKLLELWQNLGPQYVGKLLLLFLTSTDGSTPSVGNSIMNIIVENIHMCPWAKQVGEYLKKWMPSLQLGGPQNTSRTLEDILGSHQWSGCILEAKDVAPNCSLLVG